MSISETAVVKIVIDDREARAQLAEFARAKQQAMGMGGGGGGGGGGAPRMGAATAAAGGAVSRVGGVDLPAGAVQYHHITRAMQQLPQGASEAQVRALAGRLAAGGGGALERAGEAVVARDVASFRSGMQRAAGRVAGGGSIRPPAGVGGAVAAAAAPAPGRSPFGGILSGTSPIFSLGAFSLSAMGLAMGGMEFLGGASDAYRAARGVTPAQRALDARREAAMRTIGGNLEPIRSFAEEAQVGAIEFAASPRFGAATQFAAEATFPGLANAARTVGEAIEGAMGRGGDTAAAKIGAAVGGVAGVAGGPAREGFLPLAPTPEQMYRAAEGRTAVAIGRRDLRDQAAELSRASGYFFADQARERDLLIRGFVRQGEDIGRAGARGMRDIGIGLGRQRRDIGIQAGYQREDLAIQQGYGREDIERGYQRNVQGAVLSQILPGGLTGALISASIQRRQALEDLETGGTRAAAGIARGEGRALAGVAMGGADALADLGRRQADAVADARIAYDRALSDMTENQRIASDRFVEQMNRQALKLMDAWTALDLLEKKLLQADDDWAALSEAQEEYAKNLRKGGEAAANEVAVRVGRSFVQ